MNWRNSRSPVANVIVVAAAAADAAPDDDDEDKDMLYKQNDQPKTQLHSQ